MVDVLKDRDVGLSCILQGLSQPLKWCKVWSRDRFGNISASHNVQDPSIIAIPLNVHVVEPLLLLGGLIDLC